MLADIIPTTTKPLPTPTSADAEAAVKAANPTIRSAEAVSMKQTLGRGLLSRDEVANFKKHVSFSDTCGAGRRAAVKAEVAAKVEAEVEAAAQAIAKPPRNRCLSGGLACRRCRRRCRFSMQSVSSSSI